MVWALRTSGQIAMRKVAGKASPGSLAIRSWPRRMTGYYRQAGGSGKINSNPNYDCTNKEFCNMAHQAHGRLPVF
jgi:hypothetical protein